MLAILRKGQPTLPAHAARLLRFGEHMTDFAQWLAISLNSLAIYFLILAIGRRT